MITKILIFQRCSQGFTLEVKTIGIKRSESIMFEYFSGRVESICYLGNSQSLIFGENLSYHNPLANITMR